jgi:hypothetical protein
VMADTITGRLADTARLLGRRPQPASNLDQAALARLDELGLIATDTRGYVRLNITQSPGSAISALARGDSKELQHSHGQDLAINKETDKWKSKLQIRAALGAQSTGAPWRPTKSTLESDRASEDPQWARRATGAQRYFSRQLQDHQRALGNLNRRAAQLGGGGGKQASKKLFCEVRTGGFAAGNIRRDLGAR